MSHYTLGYYDQQNKIHEMCEYAEDAFEAVKFAREDVPYLQEHPFSLHMIREVMKNLPIKSTTILFGVVCIAIFTSVNYAWV